MDWEIWVASAVIRVLYQSVVVKRELSLKVKLSIYWSIYIPTLTYGHKLYAVTERTRSQIQAVWMSSLFRGARLSLRNRVRSSDIWESLKVELLLLCIERNQLRCFGHLVRMPPPFATMTQPQISSKSWLDGQHFSFFCQCRVGIPSPVIWQKTLGQVLSENLLRSASDRCVDGNIDVQLQQ